MQSRIQKQNKYFYTEAKLNAQHVVVDHEVDLPQSPFNSTNGAHEKEPVELHNEFHHGAEPIHTNYEEPDVAKDGNHDNGDDDELMHWYNNENNTNEDNFHSEGMRGSEGGKTSTSIAPGGEVGRHLIMAPILQKMAISTSLLNSIFTWSKCSIRI